jgi:putative colanic acid biosynthesis acetyltransferase WcaF
MKSERSLPSVSSLDLSQYDKSYDRGRPGWFTLLWWLVQETLFRWTPHPFDEMRAVLLRLFGAQVGKGVKIRPTARFYYPWHMEIGNRVWIGDEVNCYSLGRIVLEDQTVISHRTYLCTGSHDITDPHFGLIVRPIHIQSGVWVATECFIGPGVTIGTGTVVGARSSVFRNLPSWMICFGTPCLPVRPRLLNSQ